VTFTTIKGAPAGGQASAAVQTQPGRACSIVFTLPGGAESNAAGLNNKIADPRGQATWEWTIPSSASTGKGTVAVTCGSASASADLTIG
jgi:hypothetical protein